MSLENAAELTWHEREGGNLVSSAATTIEATRLQKTVLLPREHDGLKKRTTLHLRGVINRRYVT